MSGENFASPLKNGRPKNSSGRTLSPAAVTKHRSGASRITKLTARPQYEARARVSYFVFFFAFFFFAMVLNPYGGC